MATLYITEYARAARDNLQNILPCGVEPGVYDWVPIGNKSAVSAPLLASTSFVRLMADEYCKVAFGEDPNATASSMPLAPFHPEVFGVTPGMRIAVVAAD